MTLKELIEKRSKLIADRKVITDKAVAEGRGLTPAETEAIKTNEAECEGIATTFKAAGRVNADTAEALEIAARGAAGRQDSENPLEEGMDDKELKAYSFMNVLRAMDQRRPLNGLELEVSKTIAKRANRSPKGYFVPTRMLLRRHQAAAVTTTTGTGGILTTVSGNYIDALRALSVIGRAGATYMGGLQGTFGIPRSAGITAYWATEGNAPTDGAITIDQVVLSPKTIGARTDFTRAFMNQTSLDVENFARDTILKTIAVGIDQAAVQGTGANGQPLGLMNNTNVSYLTLATGATGVGTLGLSTATGSTLTWANVVSLETLVASANVMIDSGAYVTTPAANGSMKTTTKASNYPAYLSEDGVVNGYTVLASNIVPIANGTNSGCSGIVFGNWSDMIIGQWGALDLTVDPYALSTSGGLRVIGLQDVDVQLRHALSFARGYDAKP